MCGSTRQRDILEIIRADGRAEVNDLAQRFNVTPETVRRDLTALERAGLVRRVHGAAIPLERNGFEPTLAQRIAFHTQEKQRIAAAAVAEIPAEGGSIALDAGSSVSMLADVLPTDRPLIVVTHAHPLAGRLAAMPNVKLHLVGGVVQPKSLAAVGPWTERAYAEVHVDVAFLGANGVSVDTGVAGPDVEETAVKRAMVAGAQRTIALADHTKLGRHDFSLVCGIDRIDTVITDDHADPGLVADFRTAGVRIVIA